MSVSGMDTVNVTTLKRGVKRHDHCMTQMVAYTRDIRQLYNNVLGPLNLFIHSDCENEKRKDKAHQDECPESSLSVELMNIPTNLADLCNQLQHRIREKSSRHMINHEDHHALTAVMTSELTLVWQDLKDLVADPTLSAEENKRLLSDTVSEVLRTCEQLYLNYLRLLDRLRRQAVFTDHANRSRLGAQMALDCTSLLNVRSIKRKAAAGIRAGWKARGSASVPGGARAGPRELDPFSPDKPDATSHVRKSATAKRQMTSLEADLIEIQEKIGDLDLEHVYDLIPCHLEPISYKVYTQCAQTSLPFVTEPVNQEYHSTTQPYVRLKGCHSMPDLQRETLLEEQQTKAPPARAQSPLVLQAMGHTSKWDRPTDPAEDLRRLSQVTDPPSKAALENLEDDLPPLIKALTPSNSAKLQHLTHTLQRRTEEQERCVRGEGSAPDPQPPQADVVSMYVAPQTLTRSAAARVTDRVLPDDINLRVYPPVYNNLTGEIEPALVRWLDRDIFAGAEIKEVYEELSQNISTQYLNFDEDPMIEPALTDIEYKLKRQDVEKFVNPVLRRRTECPRGTKIPANVRKPSDMTSRAYAVWLRWWKSNVSLEDYLSYISNQDSDYLTAVFHLYDSDDSDEEEDKRHRILITEEKERKRQAKIDALKLQKQTYVSGQWNVNTVLLGGLGKEPALEEDESPDEGVPFGFKLQPQMEEPGRGPKSLSDGEGERVQERLERIWRMLDMPEALRLDMAIKYSSQTHREHLEEATVAWERTARLIQQRELVLSRLELFEREASDPSRFFQHGYHGTSMARMDEARQREKLDSQIASLNKRLSKNISRISESFDDTITYKGRPYEEKMRRDRIEMMYWLEQDRRAQALERLAGRPGMIPVRLPPMDPSQMCPDAHPTPEGRSLNIQPRPQGDLRERENRHSNLIHITELSVSSASDRGGNK